MMEHCGLRGRHTRRPWLLSAALLLTSLASCDKIEKSLGPGQIDFRNTQIDVSSTPCSANGKLSTVALRDGRYELGGYRFEIFGAVKRGPIGGDPKAAKRGIVFVGTCFVDGKVSQILFVYDDRGTSRRGTIDLTALGAVVSYEIRNQRIVIRQNLMNPYVRSKAEYAILNGKLSRISHSAEAAPSSDDDNDIDIIAYQNLPNKLTSDLQDFRPWPPPTPSERMVVPNSGLLSGLRPSPTLADVSGKLTDSLSKAGYTEYSFYRVPSGFAVVARLERFEMDGRPSPGGMRFSAPERSQPFSFSRYILQLFTDVPSGFYRFIVFIVTDQPLSVRGPAPTSSKAESMLVSGASELPASFGEIAYTERFRMNVLVYEYLKRDNGRVVPSIPGLLTTETHLHMSGIYKPLLGR